MSDQIVKLWRVACIEENKMVTTWGTEPPVVCPNDHNDRSIDHSRTVMVAHISTKKIQIEDGTPGNYQYTTLEFTVPAGNPGDVTHHEFTWPMDIYVWRTMFVPGPQHEGDRLSVLLNPDYVIGALTADANVSDTEISVTGNIFQIDNFTRGFEIALDDGVNYDYLNRITGIDNVNNKLTVEKPLSHSFTTGAFVKLNAYIVKDIALVNVGNMIQTGAKGITTKKIESGYTLRMAWTNNDGLEKKVCIDLEYNYI